MATLRMEQATTMDFTKVRVWTRATATAINHEGTPHQTFARASQNMVVALLDTLPMPSTDTVGMVYRQLRDILGVAAK
jgi:hypothetical protein